MTNVDNIKLNNLEKKIHNKIMREVKSIENKVVNKLASGKFSLLLAERDLIEDFSNYLEKNGVDVGKDIHYLVMGEDKEHVSPVILTKVDRETGDMTLLQVCLIKKSDSLINLINSETRKKEGCEGYEFDIKKLISITLEETDNGRSIYSRFLDRNDELTIENVKKITGNMFNPEKTFKAVIEDVRKEEENEKRMYV